MLSPLPVKSTTSKFRIEVLRCRDVQRLPGTDQRDLIRTVSAINIGEIGRGDEHKIISRAAAYDIISADIIEEIITRIAGEIVGVRGAVINDDICIFRTSLPAIDDIGRTLIIIVAIGEMRADNQIIIAIAIDITGRGTPSTQPGLPRQCLE